MRGISVIVPVWNSGKYLRRCVDSVLAQTFTRWELILVDDGSDDDSAAICREYAAADSRIRVIAKQHGGLSSARNAGIDAASYDYLTFIDADDSVNSGMLDIFASAHPEMPRTIISSELRDVDEDFDASDVLAEDGILEFTFYPSATAICETLYQQDLSNSVCGKLYPASLFKRIRFREGILYEDLDIACRLILASDGVDHTTAPLYYYRRNPKSILHRFTPSRLDVLDVTDRIACDLATFGSRLSRAADSRRLSAHFNILCEMAAAGVDDAKTKERCRNLIRSLRGRVLRDRNVRIKNKLGILVSYVGGFRLLELLGGIIYRRRR